MTKFSELEFNDHPIGNGKQAKVFFENGFGASIVQFNGSYGGEQGLWELAVLKGQEEDWKLTYDTSITDDVMGHLSESDVTETLGLVEALAA